MPMIRQTDMYKQRVLPVKKRNSIYSKRSQEYVDLIGSLWQNNDSISYTVLKLLNINFILERSSQNVLNRHSYEISKIKKDLTRNRLNPIIDE